MRYIMITKHMFWVYEGDATFVRVQISKHQRSVLRLCAAFGSMTTADLSTEMATPLQNASTVLNQLYRKGYLTRTVDPESKNGISYIYHCNPKKWGK